MDRPFPMTTTLGSATVVALLTLTASGAQSEQVRSPNFIVIFTDNQGYSDVGCYGAEEFETPNIDRMAKEGMRFTDFYATPACSPSRAALMTGCYPVRCGVPSVISPTERYRFRQQPVKGMSPDEVTIAEVLKPVGYATSIIGKWHLGNHPSFLPTEQGFDSYFGIPYSPDQTKAHWGDPLLPLYRDTEIIEQPVSRDNITIRYTDEAVKFIEKHRDQPFFLYFPHTQPHTPLQVAEQFRGTTQQGLYGDVIAEIDWSVGEVLETVDRLDIGEDTLIIFTSDNGPWLEWGEHGGAAAPFRGGIGTTLEGGVRVPCLMRWPGVIPPASTCRAVASIMDFLPTFAKLADANPPQDRVIDGHDIGPLLRDPNSPSPYEFFFHYNGKQLQAVRSGYWKLHVPHGVRTVTKLPSKPGEYSGARTVPIELSLFDLQNDLQEKVNLAAYYPDVVNRLQQYIAWGRKDIGDSQTASVGENARPSGERQ